MRKHSTTGHLEEILTAVNSQKGLQDYIRDPGNITPYKTFISYFKSLPETASIVPADLYRKAGLERSYCYHIWDGSKVPGRDKILRICLAAGLDNTKTRRALESGRVAPLYPRDTRDAVLIFAIRKGLSVDQTNQLLTEMGEKPLE